MRNKRGGRWGVYVQAGGIGREMDSNYAGWESGGLRSTRWSAVST